MYYGGRGYHSVKELEDLIEHYKEASYQKQLQLQMLCERNLAMTKALEYIASDFCKDNQDYAEAAKEALIPERTEVTKPEAFPWDDKLSNNHGFYDMEEMDKYLEHLKGLVKDVAWLNVCRCDEAYTSRKMHEPNAHCGEMDELLSAFGIPEGTTK